MNRTHTISPVLEMQLSVGPGSIGPPRVPAFGSACPCGRAGWFRNLMKESRLELLEKRARPGAPDHFDTQSCCLARGKDPQRVIAGQIPSSRNDFLALRDRPAAHANFR